MRTRTQDFVTKNGKVFLKRSHTQDFMTKNDSFSQEKSYPRLYDWKWRSLFFLEEVVSNIWWVQIIQENSHPNMVEYDFSWRSRTWVRLLQEKSYPGTTSPGEVVPNFWGMSSPGYEFSRVRLLLRPLRLSIISCQGHRQLIWIFSNSLVQLHNTLFLSFLFSSKCVEIGLCNSLWKTKCYFSKCVKVPLKAKSVQILFSQLHRHYAKYTFDTFTVYKYIIT
jgi:hypothetical protein